MFGETADDIREALWATHVLPYSKTKPTSNPKRSQALLEALAYHRSRAETAMGKLMGPEDLAEASSAISEGKIVWNLLAMHCAEWLLPRKLPFPPTDEENHADPESSRLIASYVLGSASAGPYFDKALDPVAILIPRWILARLSQALTALGEGETLPFLRATPTGRHQGGYSWDQDRTRALEHVHFLVGQGVGVTIARRRVSVAMKNVKDETLRSWEQDLGVGIEVQHRIKMAKGAGRLKVALDDNPDYGKAPGESIDVDEQSLLEDLMSEPLAKFGERYNRAFGDRHNSRPSEAD